MSSVLQFLNFDLTQFKGSKLNLILPLYFSLKVLFLCHITITLCSGISPAKHRKNSATVFKMCNSVSTKPLVVDRPINND